MLNLRENECGRGVRHACFLGSVDGQKVVLFDLDSRGKWLAGML